jgi:hypothetical protein
MMGNLFRRATNHNQRVNKAQNIEIYSPASSGGNWKYKKYVTFPWSLLETTSMQNHKLYKNVCFEKIRSLFQQVMMSQTDCRINSQA